MFEKGYSLNRYKMNGCSFQQVLQENLSWVFNVFDKKTKQKRKTFIKKP